MKLSIVWTRGTCSRHTGETRFIVQCGQDLKEADVWKRWVVLSSLSSVTSSRDFTIVVIC